jgi:hypothetical protein
MDRAQNSTLTVATAVHQERRAVVDQVAGVDLDHMGHLVDMTHAVVGHSLAAQVGIEVAVDNLHHIVDHQRVVPIGHHHFRNLVRKVSIGIELCYSQIMLVMLLTLRSSTIASATTFWKIVSTE